MRGAMMRLVRGGQAARHAVATPEHVRRIRPRALCTPET